MLTKKTASRSFSLPIPALLCGSFGIIALASAAILIAKTDTEPRRAVLTALVGYAVTVALTLLITVLIRSRKASSSDGFSSVFGVLTLGLISQLNRPVLICDSSGKIVWYNADLSARFKTRGVLYGKSLDAICDLTPEQILACKDPEGTKVVLSCSSEGRDSKTSVFRVKGYEVSSKGKTYFMAVFEDFAEIDSLMKQISEEDTVLAYALIDNIDELMQYSHNLDTTASLDIFALLKKKMDSVGGVVKEYSRNKYLCVFRKKDLDTFIADRFSLLDDVRELGSEESTIPLTLSVGIANVKGSLLDKEIATQAALDMALQRGGDQVVLKGEDGFEFYGGKTKTVQKRTKVRARMIANELTELIRQSDNVIIMGHRFADFDAFASSLAIVMLSKFCGVKAYVVADRSDANLAGCFKLVANNSDFRDIFVDKNEAQDLITSGSLAVMTDVNAIPFCEAPDVVKNAKNYIVIDHHRKTAEYAVPPAITYIEPSASSASELVSELLEQLLPQGSLPKELADLLFAGIMLDTKQFCHNTGMRTFGAALYLRGEGASPLDAQSLFKTSIQNFLTEARFESNVVIHRSIIAIAFNNEVSNSSLAKINAAKAADRLLLVNGVLAAFAICKIGNTVHISARSEHTINVQLILEQLGGGGHFDAAGAQIKDVTIQEALAMLRTCIDKYLDTL